MKKKKDTSHLGRNPFGPSQKGAKSKTKSSAKPLVQATLKTPGQTPGQTSGQASDRVNAQKKVPAEPSTPVLKALKPRIADWLLVKLPAESFIFGLKTMLFTKDILEKRSKK